MPKLISAADPIPTLLAMVMLDRRLSLSADRPREERQPDEPTLETLLGGGDERERRLEAAGMEVAA